MSGRSRALWRTALACGSAAAIDATLATLRIDESRNAVVSVAWMPAAALAASPRPFVRLLGLASTYWPRTASEDRLLSDHIIPTAELDPLPIAASDRRDFDTILRCTGKKVVLSRARRDAVGRLLGKSPLLHGRGEEVYLPRTRTPDHAMSETDRLLARPAEFAGLPQAKSADTCWRNWASPTITRHDGLVRANHPLIEVVLGRLQRDDHLRRAQRAQSAPCSCGLAHRSGRSRACHPSITTGGVPMAASAPSVTSIAAGSARAARARPGNGQVAVNDDTMESSRYLATRRN